ncbi:peptidoglycan bridge formation glycyltransferase FemA/FemB family protein [Candidatus Daviesbacteria bacterium]|nr:peptidoglycan bridge formation glycyltransferase FemA/FemB family protein [Candidatus Daviesbacteria bacterium]
MDLRQLDLEQKDSYNKLVSHIIQSWEWGDFRKNLGLPVLRYGIFEKGKLKTVFELTLHKIPLTSQYVGYLPKGPLPDKQLAQALEVIGKQYSCAFIKVEPNIESSNTPFVVYPKFLPSPKPLFTKYNFILDLDKNEEELLKNMHPKTRYNIRLAEKKGVVVEERKDDQAFEIFLKLHFQTTYRQGFFSHNKFYHQQAWRTLKKGGMARILIGFYRQKPLSAWMIYNFKHTLYYPYGGSSSEYREVMANNLVAWEAIKLGKKLKCQTFDMWGALGPEASINDPWQGFHRFKAGYGGRLVKYLGTYDLVFNDPLYWAFTFIDKFTSLKVTLLKLIGH